MNVTPPVQLPEKLGRYRIIKPLGQGGMGSVYLAQDTELDRRVAIKIPHLSTDEGSKVLDRFQREARAAATLHHPNICPVYDIGDFEGIRYLTMAFIEGKSLSDYVRVKPLTPGQVVTLVRKLALALQEAHQRGIIHRDLKPSNVMIDRRGEPIIMDFGLARRMSHGDARLTRSGAIIGTPAYMPPEQISGTVENMGPACDVYSLGVMMFELLTGRLPFMGDPMAMLAQILTDAPPRPTALKPEIDPRLEAICLKAMAKKPDERSASMAELASDLLEYRRGATPVALVPATPQPVAAETQPGGLRLSILGGLRSLTQAAFQMGERRLGREGSPARLRRRHQGLPLWAWTLIGGGAVAALMAVALAVWSRTGGAPEQATEGEQSAVISRTIRSTPRETAPVERRPAGRSGPEEARPEPPTSPPVTNTKPGVGWTSLFNGKNLTGRKVVGAAGGWRVENGELVMEAGPPPGAGNERNWLMTERSYRDFVLRLEFQLGDGGNSGIGFRCDPQSATQAEVAILDEDGNATVPGHARTGGLHGLRIDSPQPAMRRGVWHQMTVEVRGRRVVVTVNGQTTVDASLDALADKPIGNGQTAKVSRPGLIRDTGPIALQRYSGRVRFRNVEVKDLAGESSTALPALEAGWVSLFNGKDHTGWRRVGSDTGWWVKDGEIYTDRGAPGPRGVPESGWLMTERAYTDFILKLEFNVLKLADTGVAFRCDPTIAHPLGQAEIQIVDEQDPERLRLLDEKPYCRTGSLCPLAADRTVPFLERDRWHTLTIELRGRRLKVTVNGTVTVDTDLNRYVQAAMEGQGRPGVWRKSGPIALQKMLTPTGVARFRNVVIKDLSASAAAPGQANQSGGH